MEVNPNISAATALRLGAKPAVTPRSNARVQDSASFGDAAAVDGAFQQTPDVRPEAVTRARALGSDVKYPPLETIRAIANLLAMKIDETEE